MSTVRTWTPAPAFVVAVVWLMLGVWAALTGNAVIGIGAPILAVAFAAVGLVVLAQRLAARRVTPPA